jgi:hypothetical protein
MVRAPRLEARALLEAMERGDFYASTGVVLDEVVASSNGISVKVKAESSSKYRIQFIGRDGKILREVPEISAAYTFTGDEGYVRVKVVESNGRFAWCQPVVVSRQSAWHPSGSAVWTRAVAGLVR